MKGKFQKLEMMRGFAAVYVFAGHLVRERIVSRQSPLGLPFLFGQEAVMLFFLISGFVVYYSTAQHHDASFRPYLVRRVRRIYPIYLLALALSFLTAGTWGGGDSSFATLLGNLCMWQDFSGGKPGVWVDPFCGNFVLWSLSYEWWFYMLFFPLYRFVAPPWRMHVAAALSLTGFLAFSLHPNQPSLFLMYFVLWWCGAELARSYLNREPLTLGSQGRSVAYLTLFCALAAVPVGVGWWQHQPLSFGIHPILELRHFAACWFFLVAGLLWARARWVGFARIFGVFAFAAPISYAIYVFHYPLAVTSTYLGAIPSKTLQLIGYVGITVLAAYLAEVPFQNWVNRLTDRLARRAAQPTPFPPLDGEGGSRPPGAMANPPTAARRSF